MLLGCKTACTFVFCCNVLAGFLSFGQWKVMNYWKYGQLAIITVRLTYKLGLLICGVINLARVEPHLRWNLSLEVWMLRSVMARSDWLMRFSRLSHLHRIECTGVWNTVGCLLMASIVQELSQTNYSQFVSIYDKCCAASYSWTFNKIINRLPVQDCISLTGS